MPKIQANRKEPTISSCSDLCPSNNVEKPYHRKEIQSMNDYDQNLLLKGLKLEGQVDKLINDDATIHYPFGDKAIPRISKHSDIDSNENNKIDLEHSGDNDFKSSRSTKGRKERKFKTKNIRRKNHFEWTSELDDLLKNEAKIQFEKQGKVSWKRIIMKYPHIFSNCTISNMQQRYSRTLGMKSDGLKKGSWSEEEKQVLMNYVHNTGCKKWSHISHVVFNHTRSDVSVHAMYRKIMKENAKMYDAGNSSILEKSDYSEKQLFNKEIKLNDPSENNIPFCPCEECSSRKKENIILKGNRCESNDLKSSKQKVASTTDQNFKRYSIDENKQSNSGITIKHNFALCKMSKDYGSRVRIRDNQQNSHKEKQSMNSQDDGNNDIYNRLESKHMFMVNDNYDDEGVMECIPFPKHLSCEKNGRDIEKFKKAISMQEPKYNQSLESTWQEMIARDTRYNESDHVFLAETHGNEMSSVSSSISDMPSHFVNLEDTLNLENQHESQTNLFTDEQLIANPSFIF